MKLITFVIFLTISGVANSANTSPSIDNHAQLIGTWVLDMTPNNPNDNNFAKMTIDKIEKGKVYGEFYRDGVKMQYGVINKVTKRITVALVSSDNSGKYNSSFYLENGMLYGTTHAIERGFLAIWTATKQ
ncbi:hypothetical protein [Glaciecola petra]|uniref:Lipocalin-like domain-containing protein n=1 Tax=Glaciecola petra TaxID=3075602 RepID=A0ABU2ZMR0_9ALTE|nr:hypothetical protein [Aestuariibacter sp. P117]MDT0593911.1 hypothetical protein [Aestuariibacter sp. P117]